MIDASAAYLERGVRSDHPLDLLEALRLAHAAQERAPGSPEALFNFGQALHHLHLRRQEAKIWRRYLEQDSGSGWSAEARRFLAEAEDESFRRDREVRRREILNAREMPEERVIQAVDRYPHEAREAAEEELLGRWAEAFSRGERAEADHLLSRIDQIARQLAVRREDWLLADSVEALRTAVRVNDSAALDRLVQAHLLFQQGMRSYHGQDFAKAEALLEDATEALRHAGTPLWLSARFYRGICLYYGDAERSRALFSSLLDTLPQSRYPSLTGRVFWMIGTVDLVQGRFEEAIRSFTAMRAPLEQGAGEGQAAMADVLMAEACELRGDVERGWKHRLQGLRLLTVQGTLRRRHPVLLEGAQALIRRDQPELALLFLDEVLDNAALWKRPMAQAEAYMMRSRVWLLMNDSGKALEDSREALAAVSRMPDSSLKSRIRGSARLSLGMALERREPRRALRELQQGYALQKKADWEVEKILYLNSMAQAHLALSERGMARNFLEQAVQTYESYRTDALDTKSRITIFQHAQQSFDELMRLSWPDPGGGIRKAFAHCERARARALLDAWEAQRPLAGPADAAQVLRELPSNVTLVQYAVLPEEILIWVFEGGRLRGRRQGLKAAELETLADAFRRSLEGSDPERARELGAQLYDRLLRDLSLSLSPGGRLVIVPDGPLERIPFAALYDRRARSYLIEKAPLSTAPSATLLLAALRKARLEGPATLLAAAPDLSRSPYAFLPPLPAAREEARRIAGLYPRATVLEGEQADSTRFLKALPEHSILHFSGHAVLLDPDSGRVFLLLAPAGAGDRGEVSIASLRGLPLARTRLVVLAACRTMNGYSPGREGALSIAGAFFAAGAPTVVATLWDLEDRLSLDFMSRFHERVAAGEDPASALRSVMIDFISSGDPARSSPSVWGVFSVLGA
ncbi:MAG TPA: CHAT domain-containing protein [Thermoanaerobaculia bacterium]|nr:CHAT domain-containing protein [Thermoanaerobaculia bacterium]